MAARPVALGPGGQWRDGALWHPGGMLDAPSMETSRGRLDQALSNPVWLKMSLLIAEGLG